jgi:hypothetical protein
MKQYRITSADFVPKSDDDCYLSPDDPIHELMKTSQLGGIGSEAALARYNHSSLPIITGSDKGQIAREQNIQSGTSEWFKHWFGRNNQ